MLASDKPTDEYSFTYVCDMELRFQQQRKFRVQFLQISYDMEMWQIQMIGLTDSSE